jgi:Ca-activated chloride channel family protein
MQFLYPGMFAVLGLIPVILLIHALKPKPKPAEVTNLFLWQEVLKERGGNVTLKQLKKNLPLLLQILIVILAALALASPVWFYFTQKKGDLILVIDTSASMKTKRASGTRFDLARKKALEVIDQQEQTQKILIIEAGSEPAVKSGFLEDPTQAKDLVKSLMPSDAPGKLEKALYLALSFIDPSKDDTIYLITDGAGCDFSKLLQIHPKIVPIVISGGEKNIGITKFEFRQDLDRPDQYEIMLEVKNFTPNSITCPIHLSIDNSPIVDIQITFDAREKHLLIFPYSGLITGIAKAELDIEDDFLVDNTAYLSLSTSKDLWVMLVSQGNYFLEKLLETYPNFLINAVTEIIPSSWQEQVRGHDLVIIDRMDFPVTKIGNFLLIDAYSPSIPVVKIGQVDFPGIFDWDRKSPLMANVNLSGLTIEQAAKIQVDNNILYPVIESSQTGLMYTYEKDGLRAVFLGFDLNKSDLPLKVAFPVMMSNIINWLNPNKLNFSVLQTKAGEPYNIYLHPDTKEIFTRAPNEKAEKYQVTSNPFTYTNTQKVGIYTITENKKRRYFTVNLVDESESDITVPNIAGSSGTSNLTPSVASRTGIDAEKIAMQRQLWPFVLLLGLAVMMVEWYVWLKVG